MKIIPSNIPEVLLIEPQVFGDQRGCFLESFHVQRYAHAGIPLSFVQDNVSRSRRGVLRGLHYQLPNEQGKLIYVTRGAVFDVAVDIRYGSPMFGRSVGYLIDDQNRRQIYIPPGFAHGFCVLSEEVDFIYKCTDYYAPQSEHGINWRDVELGIQWPIDNPILSAKDEAYPNLRDVDPIQLPRYRK